VKKHIAIFLVLVLVIAMLPAGLAAAEEDIPEEPVITEPEPDSEPEPDPEPDPDPEPEPDPEPDPDPGLLPDSPFYFLKRFVENIRVWFTFNSERKTALLSQLVETRALELKALEEKFAEKEITESQQKILQKAAEDLEAAAEGLFEFLLGDGEDLENMELTEEGLTHLETALVNLGAALDSILEAEDPVDSEDPEPPEDPVDPENPEDPEEEECPGNLSKWEKYEWRIRHLERIRDRNPESCHKGLNRAIENARRQQRRWAEKNGYPLPEEDEDVAPEEAAEEELNEEKNNKGNGNAFGKNKNKNKNKNKDKNKNKPGKDN